MFSLASHRLNSEKHVRELQRQSPYETPINVKQVCNLRYGDEQNSPLCMADYYEPMALTRADSAPQKATMPIMVLLCDNPIDGSKNDVMPFAMEMARRGVAVYAVDVSGPTEGQDGCFWQQVQDVMAFLYDLSCDRFGFGVACRTLSHAGNDVVLAGCGTGALLAGVCLRLAYNVRMREYFALRCPWVARYFGMDGQAADPVQAAAFVSVSGNLCMRQGQLRFDQQWFGKDYTKQKLASYLDFTRWLPLDLPPLLLVTSKADVWRDQSLQVAAATQNVLSCRLLDYPKEDAEQHILENLFSVRYPLWGTSRDLNAQIAAFCKALSAK